MMDLLLSVRVAAFWRMLTRDGLNWRQLAARKGAAKVAGFIS
jgi:hypothetical protein